MRTVVRFVRADNVGFVFQSFHLVPSLNALENVMLPLELAGHDRARAKCPRADRQGGPWRTLQPLSGAALRRRKTARCHRAGLRCRACRVYSLTNQPAISIALTGANIMAVDVRVEPQLGYHAGTGNPRRRDLPSAATGCWRSMPAALFATRRRPHESHQLRAAQFHARTALR